MRKFPYLLLWAALSGALHAAMPGDTPGETPHRLEWVDCSPMPLGKLKDDNRKDIPDLRAIVFMPTAAENSESTLDMLENLRLRYAGKVLFAVITPDSVDDAETLRRRRKDMRLRLAVDTTRKVTPEYMRGMVMLFPTAFLMDADGMILWRGEAADLAEALAMRAAGTLDVKKQRECDPLVFRMHSDMRDGNMFKTKSSALRLLAASPGNPAAVRMAVFAAEQLNAPKDAWDVVAGQLKKVPDSPRLHFTALDLTMRHAELRGHLGEVIDNFAGRNFAPEIRCAFADTLLSSFPFESAAVIGAERIIAGTVIPPGGTAMQSAHFLAVRARLHYAFCDLEAAEADMRESVQFFRAAGSRQMLAEAEKQLAFYREMLRKKAQGSRH